MKKILITFMVLNFIMVLTACGTSSNIDEQTTQMDDKTIQEILSGQKMFVDFDSKEEVTITSLPQANSQYLGTPWLYAVVDLDNNGTKELLIEYNAGGDTAILNIRNGECIAYYIPFRGRTNLKTDGTMTSSGGAAYNSVQKISFGNDGIISEVIISREDDLYKINGENVTKEEWEDALAEQEEKETVEWLPIEN